KWPNASSAGASNTARCARPNIEASQPSLPTSCSILSPTISCGFPSSSPPEAESARKPENRFRQTEIQQQRTETAWLPQVFQRTASGLRWSIGDNAALPPEILNEGDGTPEIQITFVTPSAKQTPPVIDALPRPARPSQSPSPAEAARASTDALRHLRAAEGHGLDEIDNGRADRCDGVSDTGIDRFGHFAGLTGACPPANVTQCFA